MARDELLDKLKEAVLTWDSTKAQNAAEEIVKAGVDPVKAMTVMGDALSELGNKFEKMEVFLPEVLLAADAFTVANKILEPEILKRAEPGKKRHKVVLGTVKGDVHAVGKDIVGLMLTVAGYDVVQMGVDVDSAAFITSAVANDASIIAASALMSTTLPAQKQIIEFMEAQGLRDRIKVMVGGGPCSPEWAESIEADGYGQDAIEAVEVANKIVGKLVEAAE
jgi:trimethylamine corrinoid protein